jgi:tetratricopeptide (TPR) repeat protein
MRTYRYIISTLAVTVAMSVVPDRAVTQTSNKSAALAMTITRADELEAQAAALHDQLDRYSEAARLYKESAALRSAIDPRGVESLAMAAHLYHYANRLFDARKTMEQAAQRALARGDVLRASIANVDAAMFAYKQGNLSQTERLGRKALKLAESPLLTEEQRASIVNRLRANSAVAGLAN